MKAAVLEAVGQLVIREVAQPALKGPDWARIKVRAVGICGSEIHAFQGTHPFRKPPSILGHEVTGEIVELGPEVPGFAAGDRVFVDPQWTCGTCAYCTSGRHNLCPDKVVLGTARWTGGLGEYIVAPAPALYPLPDHVSYVEGTAIEPLAVGVHMVQRAQVTAGEEVAVLGAGTIGMMVAAVARLRGAAPVVAVDLQAHCLDLATRHLGATHGLMGNKGPLAERILDLNDGTGTFDWTPTYDQSGIYPVTFIAEDDSGPESDPIPPALGVCPGIRADPSAGARRHRRRGP